VVAGTGPLLLAAAHYLRRHGAKVAVVAEQAPLAALLRFGLRLAAFPGKLIEAAQFLGLPLATSCWPIGTKPGSVTLIRGEKIWTEACDYLACGFGLLPCTELAELLGCRLREGGVAVDEFQKTDVAGVYAAGEITGIGGLDLALVEGEIAGYAAVGQLDAARRKFAKREKQWKIAVALEHFALRPELRALASDETLVCRCEDVPLGRLRHYGSWREAKLQTRCGMGACQGRVCGGAVEFLFGWKAGSVRPPATPARIESLIGPAELE
jgi:NADPH-dependent 2,4-dienoyl-CoA reductase/sulfur reductase-like enzyme